MTAHSIRSLAALAAVFVMASAAALAQQPANDKISLSGTYEITSMRASSSEVSMSFAATVHNTGSKSVSGKIALNNPAVIQKIYNQFGSQSIPANGQVKLSASVTVPREEYDAWMSRGPNLTFYTENSHGELKTFRIPMSGKTPAPGE